MKETNYNQSRKSGALYDVQNLAELLVDRLRNYAKDGENGQNWNAVLESVCIQLETFEASEIVQFHQKLIQLFVCESPGLNRLPNGVQCIKLILSLLYLTFRNLKQPLIDEYLELIALVSAEVPVAAAVQFYPMMFHAIIQQHRAQERDLPLVTCCSVFRFVTVFALEFCKDEVADRVTNAFGAFWKEALDFYVSQDCEMFERKLMYGFLACRPCFTKYLYLEERRISVYKSLVRCVENKPNYSSFIMSALLLTYLQDCIMTDKSWAMVSLYIRKLCSAVSHYKQCDEVREFVASIVSSFLSFVEAPNEQCIEKLQSALKSQGLVIGSSSQETREARHESASQSERADAAALVKHSNGTENSAATKSVELLEKLVAKMKTNDMKFTHDSDKKRLRGVITELENFL